LGTWKKAFTILGNAFYILGRLVKKYTKQIFLLSWLVQMILFVQNEVSSMITKRNSSMKPIVVRVLGEYVAGKAGLLLGLVRAVRARELRLDATLQSNVSSQVLSVFVRPPAFGTGLLIPRRRPEGLRRN
jgi:hypothetical protein